MQADGAIIYAAGNPALYPLEYYDPESGTYQGSIPEFLAQFAREHGYDLRYLAPGPEDRRADLADSLQVDMEYSLDINYQHLSDCAIRLDVQSCPSGTP